MAFARTHALVMTAPDDPAFENNPSDWNEDHSVSGADVGGIPYCPTATTETTSAGFTFNGSTFALAMGTITTAIGPQTWTETRNAAGVTFPGLKYTITDTASAAGSLAMQILGGAAATTHIFSLNKIGVAAFAVGAVGTPSISFTGAAGGWFQDSGGRFAFTVDNTNTEFILASAEFRFGSARRLTWASGADPVTNADDTGLSRISAGLIGVGTGAAASFAGRFKFTSGIAAAVAVGALNAAPTVGEIQSVNDALAPVAGAAVAAGGAANALVWYNGAQWTVIGV